MKASNCKSRRSTQANSGICVFFRPMWKESFGLRFARERGKDSRRCALIAGDSYFINPLGAFVGVANVGMDKNWLGHPLAMANLYGFGRLSWDSSYERSRRSPQNGRSLTSRR